MDALDFTQIAASPAALGSLATLTFLEIVLGIDNLLFVSIAVSKLKGRAQAVARAIGVWGAMAMRIGMLGGIFWIASLDAEPLFRLPDALAIAFGKTADEAREAFVAVTAKDLVLLAGGLFLLWKGTREIHAAVEGLDHEAQQARTGLAGVLAGLFVINLVFSVDSVVTAVGMTDIFEVMIAAVVASTVVMAFAARPLGVFIDRHPTTRILALAFILLVGVALVADAAGFHIPRGYLYFAIAFSLGVELLNIRARGRKATA